MIYRKITLYFTSGNKITFLAKNFKWKFDSATGKLNSWEAKDTIGFPAHFVMGNVEIITSKLVISPLSFIERFFQ